MNKAAIHFKMILKQIPCVLQYNQAAYLTSLHVYLHVTHKRTYRTVSNRNKGDMQYTKYTCAGAHGPII